MARYAGRASDMIKYSHARLLFYLFSLSELHAVRNCTGKPLEILAEYCSLGTNYMTFVPHLKNLI